MLSIVGITLVYLLSQTRAAAIPHDSLNRWTSSWLVLEHWHDYVDHHISKNIFVGENNHSIAIITHNDYRDRDALSFNVTVLTHTFDGRRFAKTCNLTAPPTENSLRIPNLILRGVEILKTNRILITWLNTLTFEVMLVVYQVIHIENCQSSDYIHGTWSHPSLVKYENTFDIILRHSYPSNHYSKLSFDYNGKQVNKDSTAFFKEAKDGVSLFDIFNIKTSLGEELVLLGGTTNSSVRVDLIYSPVTGWMKIERGQGWHYWYSNSSGFASFCYENLGGGIYCQKLDQAYVNQTIKLNEIRYMDKLNIYNDPSGKILLLTKQSDGFSLDQLSEDGRCKRIVHIHDVPEYEKIQMSTVGQNRYCFSYVGKTHYPILLQTNYENDVYGFTTMCTNVEDYDDVNKYIPCGAENVTM